MVVEEPELPGCAITDLVNVLTRAQSPVGIAHVDTHAVGAVLDPPGFRISVPGHRLDPESDPVAIAEPIPVIRGEIPVDAASDIPTLGPDPDLLGHAHARVVGDDDLALIIKDLLIT